MTWWLVGEDIMSWWMLGGVVLGWLLFLVVLIVAKDMWDHGHCWLRLRRHTWNFRAPILPGHRTTYIRCAVCKWIKFGSMRYEGEK